VLQGARQGVELPEADPEQHWPSAVRQLVTANDVIWSWKLPDAGTYSSQPSTAVLYDSACRYFVV